MAIKYDEKDLKIEQNMLGVSAVLKYPHHVHGSRAAMANTALKTAQSLIVAEQPMVYTGGEYELGKTVYKLEIVNNSRILAIIDKYGKSISSKDVNDEVVIVYLDLDNSICRHMKISHKHTSNNKFGFKWVLTDAFRDIYVGCTVEAGTILAKPSTLGKDGSYSYGRNLKIALVSAQVVSQDACVISESCSKKMATRLYYDYELNTSKNDIPLNIYGDDNVYKTFPDIGDVVREDGLLMATRRWDSRNAPTMLSDKALQRVYTIHDNCVYAKPGMRVVNVQVFKSLYGQRSKYHTKSIDQLEKYYEYDRRQSSLLIKVVEDEVRVKGVKVTPELSRVISDAIIRQDKNVVLYNKKDQLTNYRVVITLEDIYDPRVGAKLSGENGDKTIVAQTLPDEDMDGVDIWMSPESTVGRTNPGRLYEQHTTSTLENDRSRVIELCNVGKDKEAFNIILSHLKIQESTLYDLYKNATTEQINEILEEVKNDMFFCRIDISRDVKSRDVVKELMNNDHNPIVRSLHIPTPTGSVNTKHNILVGSMYFVNMGVLPDNWLACASAYRNHYNIPVTTTKRTRSKLPYSNNPVKSLGETEHRLLASYGTIKGIAELRERTTSKKSHKSVYKSILYADNPTDIECAVDRKEIPFGDDSPLNLMGYVFTSLGLRLQYKDS